MVEAHEGYPKDQIYLPRAMEIYQAAKAENRLCPPDAYDVIFWHASDKDLSVDELVWAYENPVPATEDKIPIS